MLSSAGRNLRGSTCCRTWARCSAGKERGTRPRLRRWIVLNDAGVEQRLEGGHRRRTPARPASRRRRAPCAARRLASRISRSPAKTTCPSTRPTRDYGGSHESTWQGRGLRAQALKPKVRPAGGSRAFATPALRSSQRAPHRGHSELPRVGSGPSAWCWSTRGARASRWAPPPRAPPQPITPGSRGGRAPRPFVQARCKSPSWLARLLGLVGRGQDAQPRPTTSTAGVGRRRRARPGGLVLLSTVDRAVGR